MTPAVMLHRVPIVVIRLGLTRRRTRKSATGAMMRRYPAWIQSHNLFMTPRVPG
ncbi:MAG: hypothetical protein AVDCRST_MAG40-3221 [uncultured Gemmatimonadaceae bacterium]|uniref:Uncharacterized protein n=1 Tax=uncultured Gemmatimonadaceae bacterium TaxID=246130 RepID=A0A6J4ME97_9BACT|nr:MAG: hypothetical protein AVDCRST_MAG40-3221 [uncultured Gemmatimonadaceae bacterium]